MRVGVFGGTFDPIHFGHLLAADDVRRQLGLDRVLLIPCHVPPHKTRGMSEWNHRVEMCRQAIRAWPGFRLSTLEDERPGPSYTCDTLALLRKQLPGARLHLLMGADQYADMPRWHRPEELARLARIVVMSRPGERRPPRFRSHPARRVRFLYVIPVDISAAGVRERFALDRSCHYLLPSAVSVYIRRHRLYNRQQEVQC